MINLEAIIWCFQVLCMKSIILPVDGRISYQELADIVTDINRNVVSIVERLSDHVYLYERKEGALRIAA